MTHFLIPMVRSHEPYGLLIERTETWLVERLESAFDSAARKKGLLRRDGLEPGAGLVIAPSQGVHTFGMRFAIDIVAVSTDGRVIKYREHVAARRVMLAWSAFAVVELPAGACARAGVRPGDRLVVARRAIRSDGPASSQPVDLNNIRD